jgi:hypothetical protein
LLSPEPAMAGSLFATAKHVGRIMLVRPLRVGRRSPSIKGVRGRSFEDESIERLAPFVLVQYGLPSQSERRLAVVGRL